MTMTVDDHLCPVLRSPPLPFRSHRGRYNGIHQVVLGNRYGTAKPCTPVRFWAPPPSSEALFPKQRILESRLDPVGFLRKKGDHGGLRRIAGRGYDQIHVVSELPSALRSGVLVTQRSDRRRVPEGGHQLLEGHVGLACESRSGVVAEVMDPNT